MFARTSWEQSCLQEERLFQSMEELLVEGRFFDGLYIE